MFTKIQTPAQFVEEWTAKGQHRRQAEPDYSTWTTETFEVEESGIYEARAIVKDEGGLITRSTSNRPGKVLITVITPPKGA